MNNYGYVPIRARSLKCQIQYFSLQFNSYPKNGRKTQRLNKDEKVFVVKTFYEISSKSETCRLFEGKLQRNVKDDTISKLIQRFEDTGSTDDLPRPGRPVNACSPENREII